MLPVLPSAFRSSTLPLLPSVPEILPLESAPSRIRALSNPSPLESTPFLPASALEEPAQMGDLRDRIRWEVLSERLQAGESMYMLLFRGSNIPVVSRLQPWKWLPAPRNSMKISTTLSSMLAYKLGPPNWSSRVLFFPQPVAPSPTPSSQM